MCGEERLVSDYFSNRALPLVSVKCSPYHVSSSALILGDAAHAMVPFYGQGMNCGMEDCLVLEDALDSSGDLGAALATYTSTRNPDAEAMCDLAMYNYIEVRRQNTSGGQAPSLAVLKGRKLPFRMKVWQT